MIQLVAGGLVLLPVLFCWAFFLLVFTGSGAFGLDRLFARRTAGTARPAAEQTPVAA